MDFEKRFLDQTPFWNVADDFPQNVTGPFTNMV